LGSRESYLEALQDSEWCGFSCSIEDRFSQSLLLRSLDDICNKILEFMNSHELNDSQINLIL
jgi:hypothetical protein